MEPPLPGIDEMPLAQLAHRVRALSIDDVDRLIEHEGAHGNRLPVLEVLRTRRAELAAGATPSGGDPTGDEAPADTPHGSPVDPSGSAQPGPPDRHGLRQVTWGG